MSVVEAVREGRIKQNDGVVEDRDHRDLPGNATVAARLNERLLAAVRLRLLGVDQRGLDERGPNAPRLKNKGRAARDGVTSRRDQRPVGNGINRRMGEHGSSTTSEVVCKNVERHPLSPTHRVIWRLML
jgi:hypothetical protein